MSEFDCVKGCVHGTSVNAEIPRRVFYLHWWRKAGCPLGQTCRGSKGSHGCMLFMGKLLTMAGVMQKQAETRVIIGQR